MYGGTESDVTSASNFAGRGHLTDEIQESMDSRNVSDERNHPMRGKQRQEKTIRMKVKSKSKLLHPGTPSVYQIKGKQTYSDNTRYIRKIDFGKNAANSVPEKVILLVGATGSGKSTLINGMVNYIYDVNWKDDFRFKLIVETPNDEGANQAKSQTVWITSYTFHHQEGFKVPYSLTIIDTPGFGDTAGIQRDKEITDHIRTFFNTTGEAGIDQIDAIGFVAQSSLPRLTHTQRYIFDSILSLFGKDIIKNIFMLLTFSDAQPPQVLAGIKEAKLPYEAYFKFNNSALYAANNEFDESGLQFDEMFWKLGCHSFKLFLMDNVTKVKSTSLILTKDVLQTRHQLQLHLQTVLVDIKLGLGKLEQRRQEEQILKNHMAEIERSKDFTYTVVEDSVKANELTDGRCITNCQNCNRSCHNPCYLDKSENKQHCAAMDSNGNCTVCDGNCPWGNHAHFDKEFIIVQEKVTKTASDLKEKYEKAVGHKLNAEQLVNSIAEDFKKIQNHVFELIQRAQSCLKRLDQIALRPNPLSTPEYIDVLIQAEEAECKPGWKERKEQLMEVRKLAEIQEKIAQGKQDLFVEYK